MTLKIGVLASGRGTNLQVLIDQQKEGSLLAEIAVVISDKPDAQALKRAEGNNIKSYHLNPKDYAEKEDYERHILDILKANQVELIVLAGYMRLLGPALLDAFQHRIMNIHPSLLPSFMGLDAQLQALEYGVRFSGCTVHFVDHGMDTGPIILQAAVPLLQDDTEEDLSQRILEQEHQIYAQAINLYAQGRLKIKGRKVIIMEGD